MCKNAKTQKQYVVPCYLWLLVFSPSFFGNLSHMVQNLYSERELSIKLLLGEKTREKTNISPFPATHTYIKLTFVSFFFQFFFLHLSLNNKLDTWDTKALCSFWLKNYPAGNQTNHDIFARTSSLRSKMTQRRQKS